MIVRSKIKPGAYYDSIKLMLAASELRELEGLEDTAIVMATPANKAILEEAGLLSPEAAAATANDLVIAVRTAESADVADAALQHAETLLAAEQRSEGSSQPFRPKTIRSAVRAEPSANMAVISVAGRYAADEAREALAQGLHVLLFSDNVSITDEADLKVTAREKGLLLMGPGAGTALLNGVALGFANVVPVGPVGIVSAAGTGLQEVSSLLARYNVGVSQGIGVGGRDLSGLVGGIMMLEALKALQADPATSIVILISKPPAADVAQKILTQVAASQKPTIVCFMGGNPGLVEGVANAVYAGTLAEAALLAANRAGVNAELVPPENLTQMARTWRARLQPGQRYLRGLFSGGTLCYEAQVVWRELLGEPVWSNAPLDENLQLPDSTVSRGHTAVDLGEEEFTVGRLHPMMDNELRLRRLQQEAQQPDVAVIMLDVVLGYGAHPDPASEIGPAVAEARAAASEAGREVVVVASVTGTAGDPQDYGQQVAALEQAGVLVGPNNAEAARLAALIVKELG